jgi:hypothetical protein
MIVGMVLTGLGTVSAGVGTGLVIRGVTICGPGETPTDEYPDCKDHGFFTAFGAIFLAGGGVALAAGIPMWIVGAWKVPAEPDAAGLQPFLSIRPNGGGVGLRF